MHSFIKTTSTKITMPMPPPSVKYIEQASVVPVNMNFGSGYFPIYSIHWNIIGSCDSLEAP